MITFHAGYIPSQLPASCLTVALRADKLEKAVGRNPLLEVNVICEFDISGHIEESFEFTSLWLSFSSQETLNIFWKHEASSVTK
jgi:hypothetical protein